MSADSQELVYAVPRDLLIGGSGWRGIRSDDVEGILARIDRDGDFYPRRAAEADTTIKQIIPYLVLRDGERIFLMKRTKAGGDARLYDHFSVGVGGHMNPGDESVLAGLRREWSEELVADFVPDFEFLGLLNDDEVEVGLHHLGVVYLADAAGRSVAVRETHKLSGSFESSEAVAAVYDRMETWSQLVLDVLADRTFSSSPESHG
jgi:predicted NUDIX family phosphoesterase